MKCPECKQEMAKDVGGLCALGGNGQPPLSLQWNTHVCDCGGVHKALMDDGLDLAAHFKAHGLVPPPNHATVGPASPEHRQSSRTRQQARERAARSEKSA